MNIKHYELVKISEDFLKNYDMKLDIPIEFNTRIKKVLGRFMFKKVSGKYIPEKIQISVDFVMSHPKEHIIDVLKHELVHYALCAKGLPFSDGDNLFESELKKYGISSTHTYDYLGELHRYKCNNCGKEFERKRKLPNTAYCTCSSGPNLKYIGIFNKELKDMVAFSNKNYK